MTASDIEVECDSLAGNGHDDDTQCSESERLKKGAFEESLIKTIRNGNFLEISKKITPKAFTKCEKNALLMSMLVSYELRRLADRRLPNFEDETKLASSVEEFTNCLVDPLKSDANSRSQFKQCFDEVMETAIELGQKKFFTHPVIDDLNNDKWYGDLGQMWTPSYLSIGRWKWMFLDLWCLFDLVLFPILFIVLFLIHLGKAKWRNSTGLCKSDLYEKYREYFTTPYFLFIRDTLSYLALLGFHLSICLSPTSVEFSRLEWVILIFFMGRIVMETKQFCVIKVQVGQGSGDKIKILDLQDANQEEIDELLTELDELHHQSEKQKKNKDEVKRENKCSPCKNAAMISLKKLKKFTRDTWNCLDLITMFVYTCTFLLRMVTWSSSKSVVNNRSLVVAGYLYGLNTMILTFRVFGQVMETVKGLGTIQIALFSIIRDIATIFWQFVATIIAFSFAITKVYMSETSFLTEKHEVIPVCSSSGPTCWWTMVKHLCWSLLGIAELETLDSVDSATVTLAHLLYGIFLVVGVILLVNMMIALLSNTYQRVEDNSLMEWTFKKAITIQTYSSYDPIPVPLNLVSSLVMGVWWLWKKCRRCYKGHPDIQTAVGHTKKLDEVVEKLQTSYFEAYGFSFPQTEEGKMDQLFLEAEGNRRIANQTAQRAFVARQDILPTGEKAWHSMGVKVKDYLLLYEGAKSCEVCKASPQSTTSPLHHGARYVIPFSKDFPHFEVLVLETGRNRFLEVGVVRKGYDFHVRPGCYIGSVGYHADGNIVDGGNKDLTTHRLIEAPVVNRGDLIGCTVKFDMESNGKVGVVFFLNGAQVTDEELLVEYEKTTKEIYPYVGMGQHGIQLLAKMTSADSQEVEIPDRMDVALSNTKSKQSYTAASDGSMAIIHRNLEDSTSQFRRLRDNILANFREFEDLFNDTQSEFTRLRGLVGEKEGEDVLRKVDRERCRQELACADLVKKIKEDLDLLGEMTKDNLKLIAKAITEASQMHEEH